MSPTLWVVGEPDRTRAVARTLRTLDAHLERAADPPSALNADDIGIVYCAGHGPKRTARAVKRLRSSTPPSLPVFLVVEEGLADDGARSLYAAGATAVIHWPREALILARLVAELLGLSWVRGPADRADTALARAVRAHLRLTRWPTAGIKVDARGSGDVQVSGNVMSLPKKRDLEKLVSSVPGVKRVLTDDLWVEPSGRADRSVAAAVRSVLSHTSPEGARTVSVSVRNGNVVLAGNVTDRKELRRIDELTAQVLGVRSIRNMLAIAPKARKRDTSLARRAQTLLSERFPDHRLEVTAFSSVIVVAGVVDKLARRREVEEFLDESLPEVERVVNKIDVARDRRRGPAAAAGSGGSS